MRDLAYEPRLVESYLTLLADADYHQVNAAYGLVIRCAVLRYLADGYGSVGKVYVFGLNVDVVEEVLVNAEITALHLLRGDGVELVETEYRNVAGS